MAVKSVVRVVGSRKLMIDIEKPARYTVEETCLAGHGEKSDSLTDTL